MQRTTLTVGGQAYVLAQGTPLAAVKLAVENAVRESGRFVDVTVIGNMAVSVLISPGVPVFLETREVEDDDRDTGDIQAPFDSSVWDISELY